MYERLGGKVLIVVVDHKDKAGNIYGTVTHNRARGTHLLEPMKKIVKELMNEGKTVEEIGKRWCPENYEAWVSLVKKIMEEGYV